MSYDHLDHLNSLISEDVISEEEDYDVSNDYCPTNLHTFSKNEVNLLSAPIEEDIEIESSESPLIYYESDSSQKSDPSQVHRKVVLQNSKLVKRVGVNNLKDVVTASTKDTNTENVVRTVKLPSSRAILPSNSTILVDSKRVDDYSMLENKINDSLLDMLQGKFTKTLPKTVERYQTKEKDESLKIITIFPSKSVEKTINLMVRGKTCRSKQLLNATEMRIVSRIVNQEAMFGSNSGSYKNVYYDPESDTNIRYEVRCRTLTELDSNPSAMIYLQKKTNPNSSLRTEKMKPGSLEGKLVGNKIARARFGRISRPPRHSIRDYKRLKYMSEHDMADENENSSGFSDDDMHEDIDVSDNGDGSELEKRELNGLSEPSKRRSSLSICPTCNKVYPGYICMAIHFQKFPHHKDEKLLQQLLKSEREEANSENPCDKPLNFSGNKLRRNNNASLTSPSKKKSKLNNTLTAERLRSPAVCIKELLSRFGAKEIAKYAGPVVAETMNSWEYLLMRGAKLKSRDGPLLLTLLRELKVILAQIQAMSSHTLEPLTAKNKSSPHRVMIGPEDVLQHVLGVTPGTYVISDSSKQLSGAPPKKKQITALSQVNPAKPQPKVHSTNDSTAKLFDAVVAECLRDESSVMDTNTTKLNPSINANHQNAAVLVYKDAVADGKTISTNEVPIFTTNDLPVSTQLVVPQEMQPVNNGVNSPLILDFSIFDETPCSSPQLPRNATGSASMSLTENSGAQNEPEMSNVVLSMPSLDDSRQPSLETNNILDFSMLQ